MNITMKPSEHEILKYNKNATCTVLYIAKE